MNKISLFILLLVTGAHKLKSQSLPSDKEVIAQMEKVADWQLAPKWSDAKKPDSTLVMSPKTWEAGAFYPGIMEIYCVTHKSKYLEAIKQVAKLNHYERGSNVRNADDQAILQTYLELYQFDKKAVYLEATRLTLDSIMAAPKCGAEEYSWCDLLFMGPPVWAKFAHITKNTRYLIYQDKIYWEAVNNLMNKDYHLFYRDDRFKSITAKDGKPIFWSRGNGWVIAGLVRVLDEMPKNFVSRKKYEKLLVELAMSLKPLQSEDGFWKSSLLDPTLYPNGETSGTAFFCYGIAWGINNGILSKKAFLPVVEKAWKALSTAVHSNGKLGFVQPGGRSPISFNL